VSTTRRPWWHRLDNDAKSIATIPDEIIDQATPEQRATMAGIWQERGNSELKVGHGFTVISSVLFEFGADEKVVEIASQAVRDEVHHSQIALALAARYRNDEEQWPGAVAVYVPSMWEAEGLLRATLMVTAMCNINETLACSVLEAQLMTAKSPLAKAAYQSVLSDEIEHARMGWAHLASKYVGPKIRKELGTWLPRLLEARLRELFDPHPLPGEDLPDHGILTRKGRQAVIHAGLTDVVLPGFGQLGIDTEAAANWTRETFS
jgi:hypothetical protein